jgi:hypothetical protein
LFKEIIYFFILLGLKSQSSLLKQASSGMFSFALSSFLSVLNDGLLLPDRYELKLVFVIPVVDESFFKKPCGRYIKHLFNFAFKESLNKKNSLVKNKVV